MRRIRLIFRSGHVEEWPVGEKEITWTHHPSGMLTALNIPEVLGNCSGVYLDVSQVAAFLILDG